MALTFFTVTGTVKAIITDSADLGGTPDTQNVSCSVLFTPNIREVYSPTDTTVYPLAPVRARTNLSDGQLRTINDDLGVRLVAASWALGDPGRKLIYEVTFSNVVFDRRTQELEPFAFEAPWSDVTVDLATVDRIPDYFANKRRSTW